ncbi:DoxX family protein [Chryseobacterium arachidis]|uniref:DoxX family protein n=1 Tax=Chryseobacterium arachidis TaxID=1416778 RepID=UPI00361077A1
MVRLPKLTAFSQWMIETFSKSMLPQSLISPFSYILPVAEFTIGILLILGIFSPKVIIAGFVVMIILMFGTCLIENWEALPSQMMHAIILVVLYQFISANSISLDQFFKK